jgi:hypothetical protein
VLSFGVLVLLRAPMWQGGEGNTGEVLKRPHGSANGSILFSLACAEADPVITGAT